jgi:hypothetical protein
MAILAAPRIIRPAPIQKIGACISKKAPVLGFSNIEDMMPRKTPRPKKMCSSFILALLNEMR